jgi:hypothetical protein
MEKPPSGSDDAFDENFRRILETLRSAKYEPPHAKPPAAGEQAEATSEEGRSLNYICRLAQEAHDEGHPASVPLTEPEHQARTGIRLQNNLGTPELHVGDPSAYATALKGLQPPNDPTQQAFRSELLTTAGIGVISSFVGLHLYRDGPVIEEMYGGIIPPGSEVKSARYRPLEFISEREAIATGTPGAAATIAQESERLGTHRATVTAFNMLALAQQDELVTEFVAAYDLGIITTVDTDAVGVDRLSHPRNWDATYKFLQHLRNTAPDAAFTRQMRDTLLNDIDRQLSGYDNTEIPISENHPFYSVEQQMEMQAWRNQTVEGAIGMLRQARQLITRILPAE